MAIYHLEAKVISRGAGRSAVAAAAYMSCSQITNEYDGVQHDYTRKQGLVWSQVILPENARQNGQTGRFYGTPWRKTKRQRTAASPGNLWRLCPSRWGRRNGSTC